MSIEHELKIFVRRNTFGVVFYHVYAGDLYGIGETLQEALDCLTHDLAQESING